MAEQADVYGKKEEKGIKTTKRNESCRCAGEKLKEFRKQKGRQYNGSKKITV